MPFMKNKVLFMIANMFRLTSFRPDNLPRYAEYEPAEDEIAWLQKGLELQQRAFEAFRQSLANFLFLK